MVVAAGNEMTDVDAYPNYPGPVYNDKTYANNMLTVGASSFDSLLVAQFSNYGATKVDVFAPGVYITTTGLNNTYKAVDGTSFSTPVVVGLAAFIWSYFPNLTCKQLKYCIERSATPIKALVSKPGTNEKVPFSSLSKTGGIVNAYNAILIAQTFTKKR